MGKRKIRDGDYNLTIDDTTGEILSRKEIKKFPKYNHKKWGMLVLMYHLRLSVLLNKI